MTPVQAILTSDPGAPGFMEGFEIVTAPRLRVEMELARSFPLPAGRSQHFLVTIANGRSPDKFISSKAGPCKGAVSI